MLRKSSFKSFHRNRRNTPSALVATTANSAASCTTTRARATTPTPAPTGGCHNSNSSSKCSSSPIICTFSSSSSRGLGISSSNTICEAFRNWTPIQADCVQVELVRGDHSKVENRCWIHSKLAKPLLPPRDIMPNIKYGYETHKLSMSLKNKIEHCFSPFDASNWKQEKNCKTILYESSPFEALEQIPPSLTFEN